MTRAIKLTGDLPPRCAEALSALREELGFVCAPEGFPVECRRGDGLRLTCDGERAVLTWSTPVQLYRGLSLLPPDLSPCALYQRPAFPTLGFMVDASRNAVPQPESLRRLLRRAALMGFSLCMLYTEDTYEVPSQPYFGYQRGRYTQAELRALDDYADALGIELCPCIQTLGHLNRALHWPALSSLKDNEEVVLEGSEEVYAFLTDLIRAASAPYRSRRIHIGMDEAHGVGLGAHLRRHGYEAPYDILRRHLRRVLEITSALGLEPMMWSDMYFRPDSPTGGYYDSGEPSESARAAVDKAVTLTYWDYHHEDQAVYADMLRKHALLGAPTAFAGGIWTWCGPAPDYDKTAATMLPALRACREAGVSTVLATAWGDNGAETNLQAVLLGLQLYAEFTYAGECGASALDARFCRCCAGDPAAFRTLSAFNTVPGMHCGPLRPVNAAKFLLYQDPLVQLYAADVAGLDLSGHYAALSTRYDRFAREDAAYAPLWRFYAHLGKALALKCCWHEQASAVVLSKDREKAAALCGVLAQAEAAVEELRLSWAELWLATNKPQGFEILDGRLGAVEARLRSAAQRMDAFGRGEAEDIPELSCPPLPYTLGADGTLMGSYAMNEIVSAGKLDL